MRTTCLMTLEKVKVGLMFVDWSLRLLTMVMDAVDRAGADFLRDWTYTGDNSLLEGASGIGVLVGKEIDKRKS